MKPEIDVGTRVSAELSDFIEQMTSDPDREEPPTLGDVRAVLERTETGDGDSLHSQAKSCSMLELDELIAEYGEEAPAIDFVGAQASEELSRIIEAAMDDAELAEDPTLGLVREAIANGLAARLIEEGAIDLDDDATVLLEIEELIRRYGEGAVAEVFIRFQ